MGVPGAMRRTIFVTADVSDATLLSERTTSPPKSTPSCANGRYMTERGGASSPPSCVLPTTPTIVRQSPLNGVKRKTSPVHATRFPIGSSCGKNLSTSARFTTTTRCLPGPSPSVNSRPASSGIPDARKKSGLAVRNSAVGTASPGSSDFPSALISSCTMELRSGIGEPTAASVTPGSARISRCMRRYVCLAAASAAESVADVKSSSCTSIVSTDSVVSPVRTSESRSIVRVSSPAPASRTTDTAICAMTRARWRRCFRTLPLALRPPPAITEANVPSRRQRRHERKQERQDHRQREREAEYGAVERDLARARRIALGQRDQEAHARNRDERADDGARQREDEILHQQQSPEPSDPGAERRSRHELVLAFRRRA